MIPEIGKWYEDNEKNQFEIVAMDEKYDTLEIQYFNGDLDEIEMDTWHRTAYTEISAPEDWTGPYDEMEKDDISSDDTVIPEGYQPLETLDWDDNLDSFSVD